MKQKIAILDLGSNSIRTTIFEYEKTGEYKEIERIKETVRISKGMGADKILQTDAIDRALQTLTRFKQTYEKYPQLQIIAVATAAIRQAVNQKDFLKLFEKTMGFPLRVISGLEEAKYDFYGVISALSIDNGVIVDTGGASTELILIKQGNMKDRISIPYGAVNITENFLSGDPITSASLFSAYATLSEELNNISWLNEATNFKIIAIGGPNRTLAKIRKNELNEIEVPINGYQINREITDKIIHQLLSANNDERKNIKGLAKDRAEIIVGGLIPIRLIMDKINCEEIIFSQSGVQEGILYEEINK